MVGCEGKGERGQDALILAICGGGRWGCIGFATSGPIQHPNELSVGQRGAVVVDTKRAGDTSGSFFTETGRFWRCTSQRVSRVSRPKPISQ